MKAREEKAIDRRIGANIAHRRKDLGLSRGALGALVGISAQQIAKYENGTDRTATSRLVAIAIALHKPLGWFIQ